MLALLLALVWAPLMSHCVLETVPGFEFLRCDASSQASSPDADHCSDTGCCSVENGDCHPPSLQPLLPLPLLVLLPLVVPAEAEVCLPSQNSLPVPTPPPPDLASAWQFMFRTALPARAPSSVS
jgi:hypothetical protein